MSGKIRILYYTTPFFWDTDLSLLRGLKDKVDLHVVVEVTPYSLRATDFELDAQPTGNGLVPATRVPGMEKYARFLDLERVHVANMRRSSMLSADYLRCGREVRRLIRRLDPDVVHVNNFPNGMVAQLPFLGRNTLSTIHDPLPHQGEETRQAKLWRRLFLARIRNVVLYNRSQTEAFRARWSRGRELRVHQLEMGPHEYLVGLDSTGAARPDKFLLFFGRISRYKGVDVLLEAFERLSPEFPDVHLVVAGKGAFWFDASRYEKHDRIHIRNEFISTEDLAGLIRDSMALVCPYIEATQSGVVMSAFAFDKPVVATDVGGLPEMIEEAATGYLVPPSDSRALEDRLRRILRNPELLAELSAGIRERFHGTGSHGWDATTDKLVGIYREIASRTGHART